MAEDELVTLGELEGDGDPAPEPATPDPSPAPAPAAEPASPDPPAPPTPEPDPETEADPRMRGVLKSLAETRREAKQFKEAAEAGAKLANLLQSRPDILHQLQSAPPMPGPRAPEPAAPPEPTLPEPPDHELRDLAEALGLYTADGRPDTAAAKRVHGYSAQVAGRVAEQAVSRAVEPLQRTQVHDRATARRAEALQVGQQLGIDPIVSAQIVDSLMTSSPELLANPQTATVAMLVAAGVDAIQRRGRPAPAAAAPQAAAPPTFTESSAPRAGRLVISDIERDAAKRAGIKPDAWMQTLASIKTQPSGALLMEDDD